MKRKEALQRLHFLKTLSEEVLTAGEERSLRKDELLFDGGGHHAEAAEDGTACLIVPPDAFRRCMAGHPEIAEQALRAVAARPCGTWSLARWAASGRPGLSKRGGDG